MFKSGLSKNLIRPFPNPVEFFCPRKYRGYFVRGQSMVFPYETYEDVRGDAPLRFYQVQLVALVREATRWIGRSEDYRFGRIIGETKDEFEDFRTRVLLAGFKGKGSPEDVYPLPLAVENSVLGVRSSSYLDQCVNNRQDSILVSLDVVPILVTDAKKKYESFCEKQPERE